MTENSKQVNALIDRLERWLVVQPEWPACFTADRQTRRQASKLLAQRLFTLPKRVEANDVVIDRTVRRALDRRLKAQFKEFQRAAKENVGLMEWEDK